MAAELFLPYVAPEGDVPMASHVRGTVIIASLLGLRRRGHGDRYMTLLDRRHHETVASLTASVWLPVDFAIAHYSACDRLELDRATIESIGADTGRVINESVLKVLTKLSAESGVTPLFVLGYSNKLAGRTWMGGSFGGWKLGPKEARLDWIQQPASYIPYFRTAFGGFVAGICGRFTQKLYVREMASHSKDTVVSYRVSWV